MMKPLRKRGKNGGLSKEVKYMKNKILFLIDLTDKSVFSEEEFCELIKNYPHNAIILVTRDQKRAVAGFAGNCTRYINLEGAPLYMKKDLLTYDGLENSVIIATGRDLDAAGETYNQQWQPNDT